MQPEAPTPAKHCRHAVPPEAAQTAAQAATAPAQEIFLNMSQPAASTDCFGAPLKVRDR